jgi:ABC-2 type transport system permease protein
VVRGLAVGCGVFLVTVWFAPPHLAEPWWIAVFALLGAGMLGSLGLIAGLWAERSTRWRRSRTSSSCR